jgi:hypothetical protein
MNLITEKDLFQIFLNQNKKSAKFISMRTKAQVETNKKSRTTKLSLQETFGTAVFGGKILQKEILQKLLEQDLETVSLENMKEIFGKYYKHFLNISCSVCNKHFLEGVRYFVGGLEVDSIEICNDCLAESLRDWK